MKHYNVGLIGGGAFMGKAHSVAMACMPMFFWPAPAIPVRKLICDASEDIAKDVCARFGFERHTDDWRKVVSDPEIDIVSIATPNYLHPEIAIAAAKAGKHVLCEKPIAPNVEKARAMVEAAEKAGVKNRMAFNYRLIPAIVQAKRLIDQGAIGKIITYCGSYLGGGPSDSPMSWRQYREKSGHGTLGDVGSHSLDIARYLMGDIARVNGKVRTVVPMRPLFPGSSEMGRVENDDEASFMLEFKSGVFGEIRVSNNSWGRHNYLSFEIYGEKGTILFDYEHMEELRVYFADDPPEIRGMRTLFIGGPEHPYGTAMWPYKGINIGYGELKIIEYYEFLKSIAENTDSTPNFRDGLEIAMLCDAIALSSQTGSWVEIQYT